MIGVNDTTQNSGSASRSLERSGPAVGGVAADRYFRCGLHVESALDVPNSGRRAWALPLSRSLLVSGPHASQTAVARVEMNCRVGEPGLLAGSTA